MRNDRLFSGLVLVIIGSVFLLNNFGVIDFHWGNLFRLWPIFLVIGGINLILANNRTVWATVIKVVVLIAGLGFVLFSNVRRHNSNSPFNYHFNIDDDDDDDHNTDTAYTDGDIKGSDKASSNNYQQVYSPDVKRARLLIAGGATSYILNTTTDSLFKATTHETFGDYFLSTTKEDSVTVLTFNMKQHNNRFHWDSDHMNEARISLNTAPVWDINLRGGAAEMKFDLTPFKVSNLNFSGGATSCKLKLAANQPLTNVSVSTGASEVEISVPKGAACKIDVSSGLSSNDFEGFTKVDGSHYTTPGYETAKNKIYIHLKGGVSDFNVKRY
jgi:hypothetical protein